MITLDMKEIIESEIEDIKEEVEETEVKCYSCERNCKCFKGVLNCNWYKEIKEELPF